MFGATRYQSVIPIDEEMDLEAKLFIRRDAIDEVIKRLLEKNYIKASET